MKKTRPSSGDEILNLAIQIEKDVKPNWANCDASNNELTALSYALVMGIKAVINDPKDLTYIAQIIGYAYLLGRRKMMAELLLGGK